MVPYLEFGEDQLVVDRDFKPPSHTGNENDALNLRFEILEQISYQAHGPFSVVSNRAIFDSNLHRELLLNDLLENYTSSWSKARV